MVTVSILVVAIVAFTGLAYQTVPMSTTQTITQQSTTTWSSYSEYMVTNFVTYTTTSYWGTATVTWMPGCYSYAPCFPITLSLPEPTTTELAQSTLESPNTATVLYSQTVTSSITVSSTNIVPAYSSVGMNDASFGALSILVIGILTFVTAWLVLKSKQRESH
ncbi:MAG: hypothetical protein ABSA92_13175 [Candidatus Bathyarchaeia archaeon]|jgi:hypothetical protein